MQILAAFALAVVLVICCGCLLVAALSLDHCWRVRFLFILERIGRAVSRPCFRVWWPFVSRRRYERLFASYCDLLTNVSISAARRGQRARRDSYARGLVDSPDLRIFNPDEE